MWQLQELQCMKRPSSSAFCLADGETMLLSHASRAACMWGKQCYEHGSVVWESHEEQHVAMTAFAGQLFKTQKIFQIDSWDA